MRYNISNYFVLENIFGKEDIFANSKIVDIKLNTIDKRMYMTIKPSCKALHSSKKWKIGDELTFDLFTNGLKSIKIDCKSNIFRIKKYKIDINGNDISYEFYNEFNEFISIMFDIANIQNINAVANV